MRVKLTRMCDLARDIYTLILVRRRKKNIDKHVTSSKMKKQIQQD